MSSKPSVHHTAHTTTVTYKTHNFSNSNVNRPSQVTRTPNYTTVTYRKKY